MSDESVHAALRSGAPLVVVESPAGCGKTHQGAEYARELALASSSKRPLILTHTHAACSVFADRAKDAGAHVEIRTIDSIIGNIASAYHAGLGLPADVASWIRKREDGYAELAVKVAMLVKRNPMIATSLVQRHKIIVCDEHQDSSGDQHSIIMAFLNQGAKVRVFGDPMQKIFRDNIPTGGCPPCDWDALTTQAQVHERLDVPHRWLQENGCPDLGIWTLRARETLRAGGKIDLRSGVPQSVNIVFAENLAQRNQDYQLSRDGRIPIDAFEKNRPSLLILTRHNATAKAIRSVFNRRIWLWEGHTRPALEHLVDALSAAQGNAATVAAEIVAFMGEVGKGFSPSAFGNNLELEALEGCVRRRSGKPAAIQELARFVVAEPDHRGVGKMLRRLSEMKAGGGAFADIEMDHHKEFWDAVQLGTFDEIETGLAEITHRRTYSRPKPPAKAISTIHKAKGMECDSVIIMPCDAKTFPDKPNARCLLYVALSRPKRSLMLVVSRANPSPLLGI